MDRRQLLSSLGVSAAASAVLTKSATAGMPAQKIHSHDADVNVMEICAKFCNEAANHCLGMLSKGEGDTEYHAQAHETAVACQSFCHQAASLMARHSPLELIAHKACAEACTACAEVCAKSDSKIMNECAEQCRRCAEHCANLAKQGHSHTD